jgi:hypothetical protein
VKVVFLDFDGVVVCLPPVHSRKASGGLMRDASADCVRHLNQIIEETGAEIVVSSTWRKHHTIPQLHGTLRRAGFVGREPIGTTPILGSGIDRGDEISLWLAGHPEVTSYVVLDDEFDNGPIPTDRWVYVHMGWFDGGLKHEYAEQAISVLGRPLRVAA